MIKKIVHRLFVVVFVMFVFPEFMWSAETDNTVSNFTDKISEPITSSEDTFSDNLFYQDVPLFIGGEAFNAKLEKIRTEENREPLGLILSGGSARAYAHIGVLKKLEEEGLVPDFIVANSMGAIVGILYSAGFSPATMETLLSNVNFNSFFSPLGILNGGVLSNRYFISAINMLLQGNVDLGNCEIPIVVVTEDLYTKRQVLFARGDLAKVTAAACAMPFTIEPINLTIQDDNGVTQNLRLIDAGTIDLGSVETAAQFSSNLIMSSAFYDKDLNLKNPITILNRTFSIGKERKAVIDLKEYEPFLIRNSVENYSFMDFSRIDEISTEGYHSAKKALDTFTASDKLIYFNLPAKKYWPNSDLRKKREEQVYNFCSLMKMGYPVRTPESYFGINLTLKRKLSNFPYLQLMDFGGISFSAFSDNPYLTVKAELDSDILVPTLAGALGVSFYPSKSSTLALLFRMSGIFEGKNLLSDTLYTASYFTTQIPMYKSLGLQTSFFPYVSAEFVSDYSFEHFQTLFQTGGQFYIGGEKKLYSDSGAYLRKKWQFDLRLMPGLYYGFDKNFTQEFSGGGNIYFIGKTPFYVGLTLSGTGRASILGNPISVFPTTDFPGFIPEGSSIFAGSGYARLYLFYSDSNITFAETAKIEEISVGGFCSAVYSGTGAVAAGAFMELSFSMSGLSSLRLTAGLGQDFGTDSLCWFISLNDGW